MKRHRIDLRLAKLHRNYTVEEVVRLFGVHENTVRDWLRAGLQTIDEQRPALILGSELRRFLSARRSSRKCTTPAGMIYCVPCRQPREPDGHVADYIRRTATTGDLVGICPACERMLFRRVNHASLDAVRGCVEVTMREAHGRISDCARPSVNYDSDNPDRTHANAQS